MEYKKVNERYILKIEQGELVHASLHEFCNEHNIKNALVGGIGAVEWVRCGYYDRDTKAYLFKEYEEVVEVTSYMGNVMVKEDSIFVHAHGTFSNRENQVFGGHVDEMRVGLVLEVALTPLGSEIRRTFDEGTGLYLMDI